jgi:hypothetical protein
MFGNLECIDHKCKFKIMSKIVPLMLFQLHISISNNLSILCEHTNDLDNPLFKAQLIIVYLRFFSFRPQNLKHKT